MVSRINLIFDTNNVDADTANAMWQLILLLQIAIGSLDAW